VVISGKKEGCSGRGHRSALVRPSLRDIPVTKLSTALHSWNVSKRHSRISSPGVLSWQFELSPVGDAIESRTYERPRPSDTPLGLVRSKAFSRLYRARLYRAHIRAPKIRAGWLPSFPRISAAVRAALEGIGTANHPPVEYREWAAACGIAGWRLETDVKAPRLGLPRLCRTWTVRLPPRG
jgi:hypothetical protein